VSGSTESLSQEIAAGLISNLIILAPVLLLAQLLARLRR
jgi:hypothetical protein